MHSGDTQWMTAGSGVLHKEGPSAVAQETGGRVHGLQLWVNLPAAEKMTTPAYQDLRASANARAEATGAVIRVIAGDLFGLHGPGSTHTPISYAHLTLEPGGAVRTHLPHGHTVLVYPMIGSIIAGGTRLDEGILGVITGDDLTLEGVDATSEVIVLTGRPIGEPVARYGPFVMNTEQEIRDAFRDYERGAFGVPQD
jgi:redox-sensitive bicupin YhaK (pirin superfamily)